MAEKKIEVVVKQGLKFNKKYPVIGTKIKLPESEAKRLLALGAVALPVVALDEEEPKKQHNSDPDAEIIALIEGVASLEELEKLDIQNPSEAVLAAANKRAEELQK